MNNDIENLKKRLIYRSQYRGTKEMDKLIGSFVHHNIDKFNFDQLSELEKLLSIDDDTLYKFYNNQIETIKNIIMILSNYTNLIFMKKMMAERLGFEPRKELPLCRFSRPVLSTAQPSLREQGFIIIII